MISVSNILIAIVIALIYLFILPFQLIIFPMQYYSVRETIYNRSLKKGTQALISRFFFILFVCLVFWFIDNQHNTVIWGITLGSFLCVWPSIYQYQLFIFWKNKSTLLYFLSCIVSICFSFVCAMFIINDLLPAIFDGKNLYLLENSGLNLLITLLGMSAPFGIRGLLNREGQENPYIDSDTFLADLYLTKRKIQFDRNFEEQYFYEISKSAEKYHIDEELLTTIIQLEKINRGSLHFQLCERFAVSFFKQLLIKKNATLGIAQISISNAHAYFKRNPNLFLSEMLKPEISIDLCAFILRKLIDDYANEDFYLDDIDYEDMYYDMDDEDMKLSLYIASNYICGSKLSLRKFALVYATIIKQTYPSSLLSTNG